MEKSAETCVLYNANCPVCNFEIQHYARYADRTGLPIRFDGLAQANAWGLTPDQAARRLHVLHKGQHGLRSIQTAHQAGQHVEPLWPAFDGACAGLQRWAQR